MPKENLVYWDKFAQPPTKALKQIGGGRLKGKTDINPEWRLKAMTELFGPIGVGWVYKVVKFWREALGTEVACFVAVELRYRHDGEWSEPVFGVGGSMLLAQERNGLFTDDDGYKKALTDALSVAMKQLGIAADIYLGRWDGSKFDVDEDKEVCPQRPTPPPVDNYVPFEDPKVRKPDTKSQKPQTREPAPIEKELGEFYDQYAMNHNAEPVAKPSQPAGSPTGGIEGLRRAGDAEAVGDQLLKMYPMNEKQRKAMNDIKLTYLNRQTPNLKLNRLKFAAFIFEFCGGWPSDKDSEEAREIPRFVLLSDVMDHV